MLVGLVRHFKIRYSKWQWIDSQGYAHFLSWYDEQEGRQTGQRHSGVTWQRCHCSDMVRARATAAALSPVPAGELSFLREIPQAPLFTTRVRMPLIVWHVLSRVGWWFNHRSQPEGRREAMRRVATIIDWLRQMPSDESVLVVTHGFLMYVLRRELARAGFAGRIPLHPQGGDICVFSGPTADGEAPARVRDTMTPARVTVVR